MGTVVDFTPRLEEKRELFQSIARLFRIKEQLFGELLYARGEEGKKIYKEYTTVLALLKLECSVAVSRDFRDPLMDKVRQFYATF